MENRENLKLLDAKLKNIEKEIKEIITEGLEVIKKDRELEKEVLGMFITPSTGVYDYFIKETVRTGTENVGKNVIKYAMFKKF